MSSRSIDVNALPATVGGLMEQLRAELAALVEIPSISGAGQPAEPLQAAYDEVARLLAGAGVQNVEPLQLPGTAPIVTGEIPAPPGAPTVLLYSHYDVVPAGDESLWSSPPFAAVERDGAIYGRGASDSKANIMVHVGALRAWDGRPPVGIKIVIEGQEEIGGGALTTYPPTDPQRFAADAMLIADMGSIRPGVPTLTIALRGMANVTVQVRTLASDKHSGQYGGAAPDALLVVLHALATLHDEHGDVTVEGLRREAWTGGGYSEEEFRALAEVRDDLPLMGTGDLGSRVWSGPAITVTGIDVSSVDGAVNAVPASARAKLNLRVHPGQDAAEAQAALVAHLAALHPFGVPLEVQAGEIGHGFLADPAGPAYEVARAVLGEAWYAETQLAATGGSIPLVNALQAAAPEAEILLVGTADGYADIHAPDERVLLDEFARAVVAETDFLGRYAATRGTRLG
jgi:acetylornithine deacetylase/succinyl-diaminopimelate desuccinylase-like protein